jgi:hypothetical protein
MTRGLNVQPSGRCDIDTRIEMIRRKTSSYLKPQVAPKAHCLPLA